MARDNNMIHWLHPKHPLVMAEGNDIYQCCGCKMEGIAKRYKCEGCDDFVLHPSCMHPSPTITIEGKDCVFHKEPPATKKCKRANCPHRRSCNACGLDIKGFVYHCRNDDYDFHPTCAKLETEISAGEVTFSLKKQAPSDCSLCNRELLKGTEEKNPGWSYVTEDKEYNVHVYCIMNWISSFSKKSLALQETKLSPNNKSNKVSKTKNVPASQGTDELSPKNKSKKVSKTKIVPASQGTDEVSPKNMSSASHESELPLETKSKKVRKTNNVSSASEEPVLPLVNKSENVPKTNDNVSSALKETGLPHKRKSEKVSNTNNESSASLGTDELRTELPLETKSDEKVTMTNNVSSASQETELPIKRKSDKLSKTNNVSSSSQGTKLPPKKKSKKRLIKIFKTLVGAVFSILLGDPTTLIASTIAHVIVDGLSHAFE